MKVILLGDSMRQIGYGTRVPTMLGDDFEVWQPANNCRFASYTLRMLFDYASQMEGAEIVHWNNGAWDICSLFGDGPFTPYPIYEETMVRIASILLSRHKKVIFATTMPPRLEHPHNDIAIIRDYNAKISAKLKEMGVIVNDLFSLIEPDINRYIREDDLIHLNAEGIEACAKQVTRYIREAAEALA